MLVMQFDNLKKDKIENWINQQKLIETTFKNGEKITINNTLANINPNFSRISIDENTPNENNEEINDDEDIMTEISEKTEKLIDDEDEIDDKENDKNPHIMIS